MTYPSGEIRVSTRPAAGVEACEVCGLVPWQDRLVCLEGEASEPPTPHPISAYSLFLCTLAVLTRLVWISKALPPLFSSESYLHHVTQRQLLVCLAGRFKIFVFKFYKKH